MERMPKGEVQQWFEQHPNLASWLPQDADHSSVQCFLVFMSWLRIRKKNAVGENGQPFVEHVMAMTRGVTADMVWLWIQSENLTKAELYGFIMHAARLLHEKVGYCLVYHGNTFMAEEFIMERVLDAHIVGVNMPRAVASLENVLKDADLPPPEVPDSDDDALSFKEADAEGDPDVGEYITGTDYDAVPSTV